MKDKSKDINRDGHIGWKELDFRDKVAYTMAIILVASGIIMAFLCFFLTSDYSITDGVLFYVSESFVTGGALLGIATYIKGKFGEITNYIQNKVHDEDR
ncbi:MAG: hypothetical protein J6X70_04350 [Muribaculaceae bacterium]|nr:hypothetical protein [Muribaculaceae bacterium]